ncbi:MAG TPA: ferredoxin [Syntrophobacteraceae bacterium]|nr:ferredoxin [Syntrophobacteraceae bacterium]
MIPLQVSSDLEGMTAVAKGSEILAFEPGDTTGRLYGLAVDIGTTTVVGYLFDLNRGSIIAVNSALNDQAAHGSDVISRIDHALNAPDGLNQLQQAVFNTINHIIENLCAASGISSDDIYSFVMVGNTAMNHLFWGVSPRFLSRFPYNPLTVDTVSLPARDLGLRMNPSGLIVSLPLVSGFIGSDTIGVVLSTGLHRSRMPKLAIDIGTNGEIVLTDGKTMMASSCAAGPAFEGAHIQCGMRGCSGAIDHVVFADNRIHTHVIDEVAAQGICGSGLVDAIAGMLREGIVDGSGRFSSPEKLRNPAYAPWVRQGHFTELILNGQDPPPRGSEIVITQKDIREFQLAKGAMTAGIRILMDKLGLQDKDIREVYLAGAFGNYVQPGSALAVGLLPAFHNARITQVGNAAGSGAKMALLSTASLTEAMAISRRIEYLELAKAPQFQQEFVKGMVFPT